MNATGKKKITASLTKVIVKWFEENQMNMSKSDNIGYVSDRTAELMANAAVLILESNSDSQDYAVDEGYLSK